MRRILQLLVLAFALGGAREARAFVFHDVQAFAQRALQFAFVAVKTYETIRTIRDHVEAFKQVYKGGLNWRNLGWLDTLDLLDSPWFDGVEGIDEIRTATWATVLGAEKAIKSWKEVDELRRWKASDRYRRDSWFRRKVDSLTRQSKRARATRAALMRQMQAQNRQLIEDTKTIKKLRDEIARESKKDPINHARITSLKAELVAVEARYGSENLILKNQQALMFLVGEDEAYRSFQEALESDWLDHNDRALANFGRGFSR
jgi:hypothetical protein